MQLNFFRSTLESSFIFPVYLHKRHFSSPVSKSVSNSKYVIGTALTGIPAFAGANSSVECSCRDILAYVSVVRALYFLEHGLLDVKLNLKLLS